MEVFRKYRLTWGPAPIWCQGVPGGDRAFRDMRASTEPAAAAWALDGSAAQGSRHCETVRMRGTWLLCVR
jgi:hypothetical protein